MFGKTKILWKNELVNLQRCPAGQKFRQNHSLAWLSRYKHFYVLEFLQKIRKFKMAAIFGEIKFVGKMFLADLQRYPVNQKFLRNRSITNGFPHTGIFVFSLFGKFVNH